MAAPAHARGRGAGVDRVPESTRGRHRPPRACAASNVTAAASAAAASSSNSSRWSSRHNAGSPDPNRQRTGQRCHLRHERRHRHQRTGQRRYPACRYVGPTGGGSIPGSSALTHPTTRPPSASGPGHGVTPAEFADSSKLAVGDIRTPIVAPNGWPCALFRLPWWRCPRNTPPRTRLQSDAPVHARRRSPHE